MPTSLIKTNRKSPGELEVVYENGVILGAFVMDVDGYFYFFPELSRGGHWSQEVLHELALKLEEINAPWDEQMQKAHLKPQ